MDRHFPTNTMQFRPIVAHKRGLTMGDYEPLTPLSKWLVKITGNEAAVKEVAYHVHMSPHLFVTIFSDKDAISQNTAKIWKCLLGQKTKYKKALEAFGTELDGILSLLPEAPANNVSRLYDREEDSTPPRATTPPKGIRKPTAYTR